MAEWLQDPALRDRLLHPGRELVGASTHAPAWLLDLAVAPVDTRTGPPLCWPRAGQRDVPGSVRVRDLGPRTAAAVAAAGRQPDDLVGTAVSLHFARVVEPAVLAQVECIVRVAGNEVGGVLVRSGEHDAPSRAGWCAFVPLTPLPAGAEVVVHWTLPAGMLGEDEVFQPVAFRVR